MAWDGVPFADVPLRNHLLADSVISWGHQHHIRSSHGATVYGACPIAQWHNRPILHPHQDVFSCSLLRYKISRVHYATQTTGCRPTCIASITSARWYTDLSCRLQTPLSYVGGRHRRTDGIGRNEDTAANMPTEFEVRSFTRSWDNSKYPKIGAVPGYAHATFSPKFTGFRSDGPGNFSSLKSVASPVPEIIAIGVLGGGCESPILGKRP